jgi:hypothetical protein
MVAKRPTPAANVRPAIPITAATELKRYVLMVANLIIVTVRQSARPAKAVITHQNV